MRVTSDFECGNGKNIVEIAPGEFRIEEVGEEAPYCKYFHVRVDGGEEGGIARLHVYPDPALGEAGRIGFIGHYPSRLWFFEPTMRHWMPVTNRWQDADRFYEDHIETSVAAPAGQSIYVSSNPVWRYSEVLQWAEEKAAQGAESLPLGESFEGRTVPRLHLPATGDHPLKVMVLSGQHPSEHCAVMCAGGIVDFLLSSHPEALALRRACDVWAVPMINVDGNVHGRNGFSMQNVNPCRDALGAAGGQEPVAVEDRLLWHWLADELRPDILFHFHGYMGTRGCVDPPYDGMYVFADPAKVYSSPQLLARYRQLTDALVWDTPGSSSFVPPPEHEEGHIDYQLALACGTLSAFYEINHGFAGLMGSKKRGAEVFRKVMGAMLA